MIMSKLYCNRSNVCVFLKFICSFLLGVENVPVLSGLHSCSSIGDMIESLHTETSRIKFRRFHQFTNAGLDSDELSDCLDKLFELRECYEDNYKL